MHGVPPIGALVAGLLLFSLGRIHGLASDRTRAATAAAGVGAGLLAMRVLLGPATPAAPALPDDGRGPWTAVVTSVGSPRDGKQVARLSLSTSAGELPVAATLPAFPAIAAGDL